MHWKKKLQRIDLLIGGVTSAKMHFQSYRKILFYSIEAAVVRQAVLEFVAVGVKTLKHCLGFMSRLADGSENL